MGELSVVWVILYLEPLRENWGLTLVCVCVCVHAHVGVREGYCIVCVCEKEHIER